jgi:hypothetical protein
MIQDDANSINDGKYKFKNKMNTFYTVILRK